MKFVMFKKSLEEGVSPIYLFDGEEEYFKERGEDMLKERYLSEPSLNYTSFNGENLKGSEMISLVRAAESFPFLSEKRLVKAVDFYPTEKEYESYLKSYFENPQESTILLIMNSRAPKGKVMDLKKIKTVTHVDCSKADDETVMRWIFTQFKRAGISVDAECCERIARYCLSDMSRVAGETEKLKAYALQGGVITAQVVDDVVYRDTDYKMYELTGAIARKNYTAYLSVMNELLAKGVDEMNILNGVCNYFRTLFEIVAMGREYLFWNSVFFVPLGALIVWRYSIQGLGFSTLAMMAGVAEMIARTAVAIVLVPMLGYFGAELANPAAWIAACIFLYPAYRWTCHKLDNRLLAARLHMQNPSSDHEPAL